MSRVTIITPMKLEIVHVKVEKNTKEKIDRLVKIGIYKNKSEAIRKMLQDHIIEHPELFTGDDFKEFFKVADKISDEEFRERLAEGLKSIKSVAQMLAEERDRFT